MAATRDMMRRLTLTINEEKKRICRLLDESFDFLGDAFGRYDSRRTGRRYIARP